MKERLNSQVDAVKELGEKIGYGQLMSIASSIWRIKLRNAGYSDSGAFVPTCLGMFDKEGERIAKSTAEVYDSIVEEYHKNKIEGGI